MPSTTLVAERRPQPRNATQLFGDLSFGLVHVGQAWAMFVPMVQVMKMVAGPQDFATILRMAHVTDGAAFVGSSMVLAVGVGVALGVLRPFLDRAWASILLGWVVAVPCMIGAAWVGGSVTGSSPAWAWMLVLGAAGVLGGGLGFALWKGDVIEVRQAAVDRVIDQTQLPVNAETVLRELRDALFPVLRAQGFTVFGDRGAWRYRQDRIDAVSFHLQDRIPELAANVHHFQVVMAQYLTCVPIDDYHIFRLEDQLAPHEAQCHLCCNVGDSWVLGGPQGTSLKRAVAGVSHMLSWKLWWFDRYADDRRVLDLFLGNGIFVGDGTRLASGTYEWLRHRVIGYLQLKLGNRREALRHLKILQEEMNEWRAELAAQSKAQGLPEMKRLARDVAFLELDV